MQAKYMGCCFFSAGTTHLENYLSVFGQQLPFGIAECGEWMEQICYSLCIGLYVILVYSERTLYMCVLNVHCLIVCVQCAVE